MSFPRIMSLPIAGTLMDIDKRMSIHYGVKRRKKEAERMKKCRNPKCNNLLTFLNIDKGFCSDECFNELMVKCGNDDCDKMVKKSEYEDTISFCSVECARDKLFKKSEDSSNNGGQTDYYKVTVPKDKDYIEAQDVIEDRKMNYAQGNILKVAWTFNVGRHDGTDEVRELNKIKYFVDRELERIKKEN